MPPRLWVEPTLTPHPSLAATEMPPTIGDGTADAGRIVATGPPISGGGVIGAGIPIIAPLIKIRER